MNVVYFTIDDIPVDVADDWSLRSTAFGGYERGVFTIRDADLRKHPTGITQGAPVRAFTQGDVQIWEGTIPVAPSLAGDGTAEIQTVGPWIEAESATEVRCFQIRGGGLFTDMDSDPHNYSQNDGYDTQAGPGKLQFKAVKGEDFTTDDHAGFVLWIPGAHFTRYAFVISKNRDLVNFEIKVRGALGPSGSLTDIDSYTLSAANPTGTEKIQAGLSGDYDLLTFQIRCDSTVANLSERLRAWLTSIRVNDLSAGEDPDDMSASDVVASVGDALGWKTEGVHSTATNVLPLLWQEPWSELLIYLADLEDNFVRMTHRGLEFGSWGLQGWEALRSFSSHPDLRPLPIYNRAVVKYDTMAGAPAEVSAEPESDPIPGTLNVIDYDLSDPQPNTRLADAVAERLADRFSQQRHAGTVTVYSARHQAGHLAILPGDVVDVGDWDLGISQPLRIHGVDQRYDHADLSIESEISLPQLLESARRHRMGHPKRRGKNRGKASPVR